MKKIHTTFLILTVCHFMSFGQNFMVDGIKYVVTSSIQNTVQVDIHTSFNGIANIPATVVNATITYTVTGIGLQAFGGCTGLTSVSIPSTVTSIGSWAFAGCTGLTSITIPNSVTDTGMETFLNCNNLTSVILSNSATSIGTRMFKDCTSLTSINIPNSVMNIFPGAFKNCTSLTSVTIPNSVTNIYGNFQSAEGAFQNCTSLSTLNIPNSVTLIGFYTFDSSGLTTVTVPNSVTSIEDNAFKNCTSLVSVNVNWTTPLPLSSNSGVFQGVTLSGVALNVPAGTLSAYQNANIWKNFGTIALGLNNFENHIELKLYPNPTANYFSISNPNDLENNFNYKIFDIRGIVVLKGVSKYNQHLNVENLKSGNYIIQVELKNNQRITKKLIKK